MLHHRLQWLQTARCNQLPPIAAHNWHTWLLLAGRGFGKTRAGAEEVAWQLLCHPNWRAAIVAPTASDARDTCIEGESGLLAVIPPSFIEAWNRSQGELILKNGSRCKLFSADAPERLRGPQHHLAWCDEIGAWRDPAALDQLRFGLRLGQNPKLIITTTPRPTPLIRSLLAQEGQGVAIARGSTFENAAHLAPSALSDLERRYAGTRLGRQELYAELIEDVAGSLWSLEMIDNARVTTLPTALTRIVVAIDPAVTAKATSDLTGIIVAGLGADGHAYVLHDGSGRYSPQAWGNKAVALYQQYKADRILGEVNQGGDLVEVLLHSIAPHIPYQAVRAQRGKWLRAEPVASLYERSLVHHVGAFAALEDEMCRFAPSVLAHESPDRVDALVWALSALMLHDQEPRLRCL